VLRPLLIRHHSRDAVTRRRARASVACLIFPDNFRRPVISWAGRFFLLSDGRRAASPRRGAALHDHCEEYRISCAGPLALRALRASRHGRIEAVFERSFYAALGGALICILPQRGGMGPLNAACDDSGLQHALGWLIRVGDAVIVTERALSVGASASFAFDDAAGWHPPAPSRCDEESLVRGMAALRRRLDLRALPDNGFAFLLAGKDQQAAPDRGLAAAASEAVARLAAALAEAMTDRATPRIGREVLAPLLGLGPGLTPSGDDVIGGAMIALNLLGLAGIRDIMWSQVEALPEATGRISMAHLQAAAEGYGHAAVHDLINAVFSAQPGALDRQLDAVGAIGHTSGWDALVGVAVAATAWLHVRGRAHSAVVAIAERALAR
jgi:hypothetical protein